MGNKSSSLRMYYIAMKKVKLIYQFKTTKGECTIKEFIRDNRLKKWYEKNFSISEIG